MRVSRLLAITAFATSLTAQAQLTDKGLVSPGFIGLMDHSQAVVAGAHPADPLGFVDSFVFNVVNPTVLASVRDSSLLGAKAPASDLASVTGVFLVDAFSTVLGQDFDGSGEFSLTALLPTAGTDVFGVAGLVGTGAGADSGALVAVSPAVPAPMR